jgi:hypothetical protein
MQSHFHCKTEIHSRTYPSLRSRGSSVGTAMSYGLHGRGSIPGRARHFSQFHDVQIASEAHPASCPLDTEGSFLGGKATGMKVTTHLHLVLRSRIVELYLHSLIRLHGVVLNQLSIRTALSFTFYLPKSQEFS